MGNWRDNKDDEIKLDGIGGVNIMVKADVHRSGKCYSVRKSDVTQINCDSQVSISQPTHSKTKPKQKDSPKWPSEQDMEYTGYQTTLSGISIPKRNPETDNFYMHWSSSVWIICICASEIFGRGESPHGFDKMSLAALFEALQVLFFCMREMRYVCLFLP